MTSRIAVLASGGGSNLQAILDYFDTCVAPPGGQVVFVGSNRADAHALERATSRGIATAVLRGKRHPNGQDLDALLAEHGVDLIVLAGYLELVPGAVVRRFEGRMLNVHPALLPAFGGPGMYGHHVHQEVLKAGVRVTGVTVHFVDEHYDRGRIIAQWPVPVFATDDTYSLAARVLRVEHLLYPRVVDAVASGRTTLDNGATPPGVGAVDTRPAFTLLPHDDARLAENIDLSI